jgi:hypothetical protein
VCFGQLVAQIVAQHLRHPNTGPNVAKLALNVVQRTPVSQSKHRFRPCGVAALKALPAHPVNLF